MIVLFGFSEEEQQIVGVLISCRDGWLSALEKSQKELFHGPYFFFLSLLPEIVSTWLYYRYFFRKYSFNFHYFICYIFHFTRINVLLPYQTTTPPISFFIVSSNHNTHHQSKRGLRNNFDRDKFDEMWIVWKNSPSFVAAVGPGGCFSNKEERGNFHAMSRIYNVRYAKGNPKRWWWGRSLSYRYILSLILKKKTFHKILNFEIEINENILI